MKIKKPTTVANVRLDTEEIKTSVKDAKVLSNFQESMAENSFTDCPCLDDDIHIISRYFFC